MSDIIPPSITEGQKKGFSSPDASWFRDESSDFVRTQIYNKELIPLYPPMGEMSGLITRG